MWPEDPVRKHVLWNERERQLLSMVRRSAAPGKHAARSAAHHIARAFEIQLLDPEMSVFRCLTAQEEAATAIFWALKRRRYEGAADLDPYNHIHKAALSPFLEAIYSGILDAAQGHGIHVSANLQSSDPRPQIQLRVRFSSGQVFAPDPPLGFEIQLESTGSPYDFAGELERLAKSREVDTIEKHVRELANRRNRVLYATAQGIPGLHLKQSPIEDHLAYYRTHVFALLLTFLLIDQHATNQLFPRQALLSFLQLLSKLDRRLRARLRS